MDKTPGATLELKRLWQTEELQYNSSSNPTASDTLYYLPNEETTPEIRIIIVISILTFIITTGPAGIIIFNNQKELKDLQNKLANLTETNKLLLKTSLISPQEKTAREMTTRTTPDITTTTLETTSIEPTVISTSTPPTTQAINLSTNQLIVKNLMTEYYDHIFQQNDNEFLHKYFNDQLEELSHTPLYDFLADIDNIPLYIHIVQLCPTLESYTRDIVEHLIRTYQRKVEQNLIANQTTIKGTTAIFTGDIFIMSDMLKQLPKTIVDLIVVSSKAVVDANFTGRSLAVISPSWEIVGNVTINLNGTQENLDGGHFLGIGNYDNTSLTVWTNSDILRPESLWDKSSCFIESLLKDRNGQIHDIFQLFDGISCRMIIGKAGSAWHFVGKSIVQQSGDNGKLPTNYNDFPKCPYNQVKNPTQNLDLIQAIYCGEPSLKVEDSESYPMKFAINLFEKFAIENIKKDRKMYELLQEFQTKSEQFKLTPFDKFINHIPEEMENEGPLLKSVGNKISAGIRLNSTLKKWTTFVELRRLESKINITLIQCPKYDKYMDDSIDNMKTMFRNKIGNSRYNRKNKQKLFTDNELEILRKNINQRYELKLKKLLDNTHNTQRGIVHALLILNNDVLLKQIEQQKDVYYHILTDYNYTQSSLSKIFYSQTAHRILCQKNQILCKRLLCAELMLDFKNCSQLSLTEEETNGYWWEYRQMFTNIKENLKNPRNIVNILKNIKCFNKPLAIYVEEILAEWEEIQLQKDMSDYDIERETFIETAFGSTTIYDFKAVAGRMHYTEAFNAYLQWSFPCTPMLKPNYNRTFDEQNSIQAIKDIHKKSSMNCTNSRAGVFSNEKGMLGPFFTWKHSEIREDLLQLFDGKSITLRARLLNPSTLSMQGLKIVKVGIKFSKVDGLQEGLREYMLKLTHSGFSHYYYNNQQFVVKTSPVDISNENMYQDDKTGDFVTSHLNLSPYASWTIKLGARRTGVYNALKFANNTDIFLVGIGVWSKPG